MSKKKNTGLLIAFGAVLGAAAAGISYYLKYKSYHDKIENEDFHDYEEEETENPSFDEPLSFNESNRTYITIDGGKGKSEETKNETAPADDASEADSDADNDVDASDNADTAAKQEDANTADNEINSEAPVTDSVNGSEHTNDSEAAANTDADTANNAETIEKSSVPTSSAATVEEDTEGVY